MGRAFVGDGVFVDLFCAVASVAAGIAVVATIIAVDYGAGIARRFVFAQASFVQINADVRRGEVNQRR